MTTNTSNTPRTSRTDPFHSFFAENSRACCHCRSLRQPYRCEWDDCGELFGRRSMLLAHVRARHDGTVKMRVVQSPGGTNQVAEVVGWNGYRTCVAVTPRKGRGRTKENEAHEGEDEEAKREWRTESMQYTGGKAEEDVTEEKGRMDGDRLLSTDEGLLYWPTNDMQDEYKEVVDNQPLFFTLPSLLPSPHVSAQQPSSSLFASYGQLDWPSQQDDRSTSKHCASPASIPSSVWGKPPPVPHWLPARFSTASLHTVHSVPSPLFASPVHSPHAWHDRTDSDERMHRAE